MFGFLVTSFLWPLTELKIMSVFKMFLEIDKEKWGQLYLTFLK